MLATDHELSTISVAGTFRAICSGIAACAFVAGVMLLLPLSGWRVMPPLLRYGLAVAAAYVFIISAAVACLAYGLERQIVREIKERRVGRHAGRA